MCSLSSETLILFLYITRIYYKSFCYTDWFVIENYYYYKRLLCVWQIHKDYYHLLLLLQFDWSPNWTAFTTFENRRAIESRLFFLFFRLLDFPTKLLLSFLCCWTEGKIFGLCPKIIAENIFSLILNGKITFHYLIKFRPKISIMKFVIIWNGIFESLLKKNWAPIRSFGFSFALNFHNTSEKKKTIFKF